MAILVLVLHGHQCRAPIHFEPKNPQGVGFRLMGGAVGISSGNPSTWVGSSSRGGHSRAAHPFADCVYWLHPPTLLLQRARRNPFRRRSTSLKDVRVRVCRRSFSYSSWIATHIEWSARVRRVFPNRVSILSVKIGRVVQFRSGHALAIDNGWPILPRTHRTRYPMKMSGLQKHKIMSSLVFACPKRWPPTDASA